MNVRSIVFAAVAVMAASATFAEGLKPAAVEARPATQGQTALKELTAGMREVLRAVVPEIKMPAIEIKLPALDAKAR